MGRPAGSKNRPKEEESVIDTSEGGLVTTAPIVTNDPTDAPLDPEAEALEGLVEGQLEPTVDANISDDPNATPASAMLAIGHLYSRAGVVSTSLSYHLRNTAGQPELFAFLQRMQNALGEFRHAVEQVEESVSEELLNAIAKAVA